MSDPYKPGPHPGVSGFELGDTKLQIFFNSGADSREIMRETSEGEFFLYGEPSTRRDVLAELKRLRETLTGMIERLQLQSN